jgi:hypothetical protein
LAGRGSLVAPAGRPSTNAAERQPKDVADVLVRLEEVVRNLEAAKPLGELRVAASLTEQATNLPPGTVKDFLVAGQLSYVKGNRLEEDDFATDGGLRVFGPAELVEPHTAPSRHISLLQFAARYPSGRLTEPGDVVFCTSPRPVATVDADGGAVVVFPARVLRIDAGDPGGLVPDVVAADINQLNVADKTWRNWRLRRAPEAQRRSLATALEALQHEQAQARQRLERLEELATLITDGVAGGSLTLTDPISNAAPNEGTAQCLRN